MEAIRFQSAISRYLVSDVTSSLTVIKLMKRVSIRYIAVLGI